MNDMQGVLYTTDTYLPIYTNREEEGNAIQISLIIMYKTSVKKNKRHSKEMRVFIFNAGSTPT